MIYGTGWVMYQNPKTGSTSVRDALNKDGHKVEGGHSILFYPNNRTRIYTFVRNPFDRMVSAYRFFKPEEEFDDWIVGKPQIVASGIDIKRTPQQFWYQGVIPERRLRFEHISEDFEQFKQRESLSERIGALPHRNSSEGNSVHYRDTIGPNARGILEDRFYADLKELGYDW